MSDSAGTVKDSAAEAVNVPKVAENTAVSAQTEKASEVVAETVETAKDKAVEKITEEAKQAVK